MQLQQHGVADVRDPFLPTAHRAPRTPERAQRRPSSHAVEPGWREVAAAHQHHRPHCDTRSQGSRHRAPTRTARPPLPRYREAIRPLAAGHPPAPPPARCCPPSAPTHKENHPKPCSSPDIENQANSKIAGNRFSNLVSSIHGNVSHKNPLPASSARLPFVLPPSTPRHAHAVGG